jgi:hypothetical protein
VKGRPHYGEVSIIIALPATAEAFRPTLPLGNVASSDVIMIRPCLNHWSAGELVGLSLPRTSSAQVRCDIRMG